MMQYLVCSGGQIWLHTGLVVMDGVDIPPTQEVNQSLDLTS